MRIFWFEITWANDGAPRACRARDAQINGALLPPSIRAVRGMDDLVATENPSRDTRCRAISGPGICPRAVRGTLQFQRDMERHMVFRGLLMLTETDAQLLIEQQVSRSRPRHRACHGSAVRC